MRMKRADKIRMQRAFAVRLMENLQAGVREDNARSAREALKRKDVPRLIQPLECMYEEVPHIRCGKKFFPVGKFPPGRLPVCPQCHKKMLAKFDRVNENGRLEPNMDTTRSAVRNLPDKQVRRRFVWDGPEKA